MVGLDNTPGMCKHFWIRSMLRRLQNIGRDWNLRRMAQHSFWPGRKWKGVPVPLLIVPNRLYHCVIIAARTFNKNCLECYLVGRLRWWSPRRTCWGMTDAVPPSILFERIIHWELVAKINVRGKRRWARGNLPNKNQGNNHLHQTPKAKSFVESGLAWVSRLW